MSARLKNQSKQPISDRAKSARSQISPDRSPWQRWISTSLILIAFTLTVFAGYTAYQVASNFRDVRAKASDNVEWSLAQVELETRDFTTVIETALLDPNADLSRLRLRFDILYSRVQTMVTSPVYQRIAAVPEFDSALKRVHNFVVETVPLIDAPDQDLRTALPDLAKSAAHLRNDTRTLSLKGLTFFAELSDRQRTNVRGTLLRLTALIVLLLAALVTLVVHAFNIYRLSRQHSQALADANSRMTTVLTTSLDGMLVTDAEGRLLAFNKACEDMFQRKFEDVRGKDVIDLIAPPHTRELHRAALRRMMSGGAGHFGGRGRKRAQLQRADGAIFPGEVSVEVAEEDGQLIFLGFLRDISDRVAAEEELMETRDQALAGERAKAEFLTVMSHEIRTPLNGILGNLSLLNDTKLDTPQTRYIRNMEISGRVLMRHVDTVLDIARHEAGAVNISLENTDLSAMLQELVDSQLSAAKARGNALSWRWEGTPRPNVCTDRAALEQVLLNLIGNAIKFTNHGAIVVEAEALPETIEGTPVIELRVTDTGIGISKERIDKVFEDFVTNDTSLGQVPQGTGLGLGIARRIVTAMGGALGVDSTDGEGSVFWVRLPMASDSHKEHRLDRQADAPNVPRRILVVEDNAINRELAEEMLSHAGHEVITASDGAKGVAHAKAIAFDLILMDIAMPVMDGLQSTRAIRSSDGPNKATPVIAVSANILPAERAKLEDAGMDGFLGKPLDRAALQSTLSHLDAPAASRPPSVRNANQEIVDIATLKNNCADLPKETFARLLARFIDEGDTLRTAVTAPDRDNTELAKMCHNLAGAAAIFGARGLRGELVKADSAAKSDDPTGFEAALSTLPAIWQDTRAALTPHLQANPAECETI